MPLTRYNPLNRTTSSPSKTYDVFLSFRGGDVRKTFVDHLYTSLENAGVNAFLDSQKLKRGDEISSTILEAIENSAVLIPIFTENFAESHWCLDQVAHMCKSNGIIIPLFFKVNPTDVRNSGRGVFAEDFEKKKQRYPPERISEWKSALFKVSSFSGWSTEDTAGYAS